MLLVNDAIRRAQPGSPLHGLPPIVDSSDEIIEVLLATLRWDMQQRRFGLKAEELEKLHALIAALSAELLEVLKCNMPVRFGGLRGFNFEKEHSILHKVCDITWSETFSPHDLAIGVVALEPTFQDRDTVTLVTPLFENRIPTTHLLPKSKGVSPFRLFRALVL